MNYSYYYNCFLFSDDYRETACVNILKIISSHYKALAVKAAEEAKESNQGTPQEDNPQTPKPADSSTTESVCSNPECTRSRPGNTSTNMCAHVQPQPPVDKPKTPAGKHIRQLVKY